MGAESIASPGRAWHAAGRPARAGRATLSTPTDPIGLCARCAHARQVPSRTTIYWRCTLAESDPRFERYPRLPVLECDGFSETEPPGGAGEAEPSG